MWCRCPEGRRVIGATCRWAGTRICRKMRELLSHIERVTRAGVRGLLSLPLDGGGLDSLRGRFSHNVLSMHTFVPQTPPLLFPGSSGRLRPGHGRLTGLVLPRRHRGPRFRDTAARRHGLLPPQSDPQLSPTLAQHAPQPWPAVPAWEDEACEP